MTYSVNDTVLYGAEGVCRVAEIIQRDFGSGTVDYYVLRPVYNENSTIFVPVNNPALTDKIRRVLSADEIREIIRSMPDEDSIWYTDENERKEKFRQILARGDRSELVGMIKALYQHQQRQQAGGKHLHAADERFFRDAEKMLYDEFALVLKIKPDQVLPLIMEQIQLERADIQPQ